MIEIDIIWNIYAKYLCNIPLSLFGIFMQNSIVFIWNIYVKFPCLFWNIYAKKCDYYAKLCRNI